MDTNCTASHTLTPIPPSSHCTAHCTGVSYAVESVTCKANDDGAHCSVSYSVTRTNADGTTDVFAGSVAVPEKGCKEIPLYCDDHENCIHSKLELCCA